MPRYGRGKSFAALLTLLVGLIPHTSNAGVWPTEPDRITRDLASSDVSARRAAAKKLLSLPTNLARPLVQQALGDNDSDVRVAAADAATAHRVVGAGDVVASWLNEPETRIRLAACRVLQSSPSAKATPTLGRVLGDGDPLVREAAAIALGNSGVPDSVIPLLGHLDDQVPAVRVEVVRSLYRLGDPRAVVPLLGKSQDTVSEVRRVVTRALGELGDPRASAALVLSLRDTLPEIKIEALAALGKLRDPSSVLSIGPLADAQSPPAVRRAALEALGNIGGERAIGLLIAALDNDDPSTSTTPAKDALVAMGDKAIPSLLVVLGQPATERAGALAAEALGQLHAKQAIDALVSAVRKGSIPPKSGLRALAEMRDPAALPVVLELLGDPAPAVRTEARAAADALLDPRAPDGRAVDPIAAALDNPQATNEERASLAKLLGKTGSPRAVAGLLPLVTSSVTNVKLAALEGLAAVGGSAGQESALLTALKDDSAQVRARAGVALATSASEATTKQLLDLVSSADEQDRGALTVALAGALSRTKDADSVRRAVALLGDVETSMRDAILEGLGRSPAEAARTALTQLAKGTEVGDRRKVAEAMATQPTMLELTRTLAKDFDAGVRANAVWSLGTTGERSDLELLSGLISDPSPSVAANAAQSVGRVAAKVSATEEAAKSLCAALTDGRSYVRAAALVGLSIAKARCSDGEAERTALVRDDSPSVRAAAADLIHRVPANEVAKDERVLSRCRVEDPFGFVASRCVKAPTVAKEREPVTVLVVPQGQNTPKAEAPFALVFADSTVRHGIADRRGAVFEASAPRGVVSLSVPAPFAK
ncbi:MAG: HEAT repeat domain-containing protein [Polyangiaceae bacterium]